MGVHLGQQLWDSWSTNEKALFPQEPHEDKISGALDAYPKVLSQSRLLQSLAPSCQSEEASLQNRVAWPACQQVFAAKNEPEKLYFVLGGWLWFTLASGWRWCAERLSACLPLNENVFNTCVHQATIAYAEHVLLADLIKPDQLLRDTLRWQDLGYWGRDAYKVYSNVAQAQDRWSEKATQHCLWVEQHVLRAWRHVLRLLQQDITRLFKALWHMVRCVMVIPAVCVLLPFWPATCVRVQINRLLAWAWGRSPQTCFVEAHPRQKNAWLQVGLGLLGVVCMPLVVLMLLASAVGPCLAPWLQCWRSWVVHDKASALPPSGIMQSILSMLKVVWLPVAALGQVLMTVMMRVLKYSCVALGCMVALLWRAVNLWWVRPKQACLGLLYTLVCGYSVCMLLQVFFPLFLVHMPNVGFMVFVAWLHWPPALGFLATLAMASIVFSALLSYYIFQGFFQQKTSVQVVAHVACCGVAVTFAVSMLLLPMLHAMWLPYQLFLVAVPFCVLGIMMVLVWTATDDKTAFWVQPLLPDEIGAGQSSLDATCAHGADAKAGIGAGQSSLDATCAHGADAKAGIGAGQSSPDVKCTHGADEKVRPDHQRLSEDGSIWLWRTSPAR